MDLVRVGLYCAAVWSGGAVAGVLRSSPIVGEIIVGALLGPPLADFVPEPTGFALAGLMGVQLAVVDAGLQTDSGTLRRIALRAFLIALVGVAVPIGLAILFVSVAWNFSYLQGFAVGAAIAPTSMGVTSRLLQERGELTTEVGKLITTAAIFDDVISLILLSEVLVLASDSPSAWQLCAPVVFAIVFIVGAAGFSLFLPRVLPTLFAFVPEPLEKNTEQMLLYLFVILLTFLADLASTSFLLGGYMAGVAFSSRVGAVAEFSDQTKRITKWLFRFFFAATIAFSIPLKVLFQGDALALGACLAFAGIVGKLFCALLVRDIRKDGALVAVAMLGRGEFGFLIAAEGFSSGLLSDSLYASTVWGVFVPTLVAPLLFPLAVHFRNMHISRSSPSEADEMGSVTVDRSDKLDENSSAETDEMGSATIDQSATMEENSSADRL